ncbi:Eco57I restriction-modification methylase domain-containing protein [Schaalia sp.]|uniref:Eco57I restriction-modification methylase domain-containing protein n=1 Tax=Schaalia sp. TaxID=2691890 RepID=UPI003D137AC2
MKETFPEGKSDLFAAFIERCLTLLRPHGFMAQVTMQSWMFLSSFEKLRNKLRRCASIVAMLHMDNMVMRIAFGTSATVWEVGGDPTHPGKYTWMELSDIEGDKPRVFPAHNERNGRAGDDGFFSVAQKDMAVIPGSPIVYWLSEKMRSAFSINPTLGESASLAVGLQTGDNNRFLREWWEVSIPRIAFACTSREDAVQSGARWFPYNKGGDFRKWYGNQEFVVNWENDGAEIFNFRPRSVVRNPDTYFSPSVSWSKVSSGAPAFRAYPPGFVFDVAGTSMFAESLHERIGLLAFTNSQLAFEQLSALAPTLNFEVGQVAGLPVIDNVSDGTKDRVSILTDESRRDWDAFEISWGFARNPLVGVTKADRLD